MADEMMRIAGRGEDGKAKAISTDNDGKQYTLDTDVKAELESIKATQAEILERLNEPIDTQVTGSNIEQLFERKVRQSTDTRNDLYFPPHPSVKGMALSLKVHGLTGAFDTGEGVRLRLVGSFGNQYDSSHRSIEVSTETNLNRGTHLIYLYPNITVEKTDFFNHVISAASIPKPIFSGFYLGIMINGTFAAGEGVDCEVFANYFY